MGSSSLESLNSYPIGLLSNFLWTECLDPIEQHWKKALDGQFEVGVWQQIDAEHGFKLIFLNASATNDQVKEYHKVYTDIHITIKGGDSIFFGESVQSIVESYNYEADYSLVNAKTTRTLSNDPGNFVIVRKGIIHCNVLEGPDALKMVVKIKDDLCLK